jgi:hypothetical protein
MGYWNPTTGKFDLNFDVGFDPASFADELVAGADIDDASKAALQLVLAKPAVVAKLKNSVALRSSAQSAMDRARDAAREAEQLRDANFKWAQDNIEPLKEFVAGGGRRETITNPQGDVLTKADVLALLKEQREQFAAELAQKDEAYIGLQTDTFELAHEYSKQFGETLPLVELQQHAIKARTSMRNAFPSFIAPKLEEKRKAEIEKIKLEAFEAGKADALSHMTEHTMAEPGGDLSTAFGDTLLGRRTTTLTSTDGKPLTGEDAFVANWNKTRGFTQPADGKTH